MADLIEIVLKARDEASGPIDRVGESLHALHGHLSRIMDIAGGNLLGNVAAGAFDEMARGVGDFGKSLVESNASIEMMRQRLNILYGSARGGAAAFAFLKQNELTKPFDIESIMTAATQLAAFKQNIGTVLPALEDVAGAMGQKLPVAARAFNDALMGRFAMLKNDLGVSKEMLVQYGLEMDKRGHITNPESFTKAFLAMANNAEFKGGADKLAQTWTGLMSSMRSQWTYFTANLGSGVFAVLEKNLGNVVHMLQDPKNSAAIGQVELGIGAALGRALTGVINLGRAIGPYVGSAIILLKDSFELVGRVGGAVFGFVGTAIGGFLNWFKGTAVPAIQTGVGLIAQWWQDNGKSIETSLRNIWTKIQDFGGLLVGGLRNVWNYAKADLKFFWDAATIVFQLGQDVVTGNWSKFGGDLVAGIKKLAGDGIQVFAKLLTGMVDLITRIGTSMVQAMIPVANNLMGPWTWLAQGVRTLWIGIGGVAGGIVSGIASALMSMEGVVSRSINTLIGGFNSIAGKLRMPKIDMLTDLTTQMHTFDATRKWVTERTFVPDRGTLTPDRRPGFIGPLAQVQGPIAPRFGPQAGHWATGGHWQDTTRAPISQSDFLSQSIRDSITKTIAAAAPGLNAGQAYKGIDPKKAQADAEALRTSLVGPFDTVVQRLADKLQGMLDPAAPHSQKAKKDARALGKEIIDNMFSGFSGMGGGMTMDAFLKSMGITWNGKVPGPPGPLQPPLGALGGDPTGSAAGGAGGAGLAGITQRVRLGQLGATFGQSLATTSLNGGQDRTASAAERMAMRMEKLVEVNVQIRDALVRGGMPAPQQTSAARSMGVARPGRL